jgi:hypothetical protein
MLKMYKKCCCVNKVDSTKYIEPRGKTLWICRAYVQSLNIFSGWHLDVRTGLDISFLFVWENGYCCLCAHFYGNLAFKNAIFLENIWEPCVSQSQTQTVTAGKSYVVDNMIWHRWAISGQKIIDEEELSVMNLKNIQNDPC